jgi:hypothetical protein
LLKTEFVSVQISICFLGDQSHQFISTCVHARGNVQKAIFAQQKIIGVEIANVVW